MDLERQRLFSMMEMGNNYFAKSDNGGGAYFFLRGKLRGNLFFFGPKITVFLGGVSVNPGHSLIIETGTYLRRAKKNRRKVA